MYYYYNSNSRFSQNQKSNKQTQYNMVARYLMQGIRELLFWIWNQWKSFYQLVILFNCLTLTVRIAFVHLNKYIFFFLINARFIKNIHNSKHWRFPFNRTIFLELKKRSMINDYRLALIFLIILQLQIYINTNLYNLICPDSTMFLLQNLFSRIFITKI